MYVLLVTLSALSLLQFYIKTGVLAAGSAVKQSFWEILSKIEIFIRGLIILSPFVHIPSIITCSNMSFLLLVGFAGYPVPFLPGSLLACFPYILCGFICLCGLFLLGVCHYFWFTLRPCQQTTFLIFTQFSCFCFPIDPNTDQTINECFRTCRRSSVSIHIDLTNVASVVFVVIEPALGPCVCICDIY